MTLTTQINDLVNSVKQDVIQWRRHLHQNPELSFEEKETSQFVYEKLLSFGHLEVYRPTETSVVARLIGKSPGKVIAMRADMDALPIIEENDFEFASKNKGIMHACGHDGHTAMLLGAAKILSQLKNDINGEVRFIFQHAEELPPGGAREMVEAGVMDDVDEIIGLHLMSPLPKGKIGIGYGPITANADTFEIKIHGKGSHASQPENAVDPIAIGSQVVNNLQHIVSRNIDPIEQLVISVTQFHGGTANNIIPQSINLGGTVRSFNPEVRSQAPKLMEKIIKGITDAHGASYEFDYHFGYASVINDERVTAKMEELIEEEFGKEYIEYPPAIMGGEDFSAFLTKAPGCFIPVGAGNIKKGITAPHHHPKFTVDEDALEDGVKILVNVPFKLLK
ncbi:amidohydrolase [Scopulibacillus daqui]|uniref:Amidohydrolase n=1 Tax=Scopulibacillus daqui TaxID=1469162 RepID=A0ABS2PV71_9BACL|nr:M20 family metallopeptidase [Scopulibacillus daqui]MBM7643953.1 amidohydrolase [Scopulibacillus daqui]